MNGSDRRDGRSRRRSSGTPSREGFDAPQDFAQELLAIAAQLRLYDDPALDAEARRIEVIVMGGDPGMVVTLAERIGDE